MKHQGATWTQTAHKNGMLVIAIVLTVIGLPGIWFSLGLAQVPPITPSGLNTQVSGPTVLPNGRTNYDITGGTRPGGGTNLFHSFGNFNVPNNNIANFLNDSGALTTNILGRVTGGNISNIFGTIQTTGFGNANLFLMNPAGFLFGPNATINVGGMVAFTSADYLRLQGGPNDIYYADPAKVSILTSAPVAAYGFLGSNPGAITVQGSQLSVTPAQSIALVGGNITVQNGTLDSGAVQAAKLSAPGGQINLASVASPGEVVAETLNYAPNVNGQSFGALGSINISQKSVIDVSGNGAGTVLIRGGQFLLDNSNISANTNGPAPLNADGTAGKPGSGIDIQLSQNAVIQNAALLETNVAQNANATPGITYGGVHVKADHIEIVGIPVPIGTPPNLAPFTGIRSDVRPGNPGASSGAITLDANSILVKSSGTLETRADNSSPPPGTPQPTNNAGNITVTADQNLQLNGSALLSVISFSSGTGGDINLTSRHGDIVMSGAAPTPGVILKPGDPSPTVNAITSQTILSTGIPGDITIRAPEGNIQLAGTLMFSAIVPPSIGATVTKAGSGRVQLIANNLQLLNGSSVNVDNRSAQQPGNFTVTLDGNLSLRGNSQIRTTTHGPAQSATLDITAHDVLVTEGSFLTAETVRSGPGGQLNISTDTLQLTNGGQLRSGSTIEASSIPGQPTPLPSGHGGTITIQGLAGPAGSVLIDGAKSGIFTNAQGTGAGGNTNLAAQSVTIQNGGTISAATSGTAPSATGGTITVDANQVQVNSGGGITAATTGAGAGGSVIINAGSTFSSNAGTVSSTATQATGGDLNITAGQSVALTNGAGISASSTGQGNAGSIQINAGNQFAMTNSTVTTEATQSGGGLIKITTTPSGGVQLTNSKVSASVLDGNGGGGSVNIDPQFVVLQNSQILAQAVQGPGGNITITTNLLLPDSTSIISASSQFGQQGSVTIQSPIAPAGGKVFPLQQKPLIATTLLGQRCAALAGGNISSFTVAGRDSLPAEPGGWLSSPLALGTAESDGTVKEASSRTSESEAAEAPPLLSLRHIAPPGFLTQSFAVDSSGCQS
jgi:filamentous hemagglutinin family protein